MSETIKPRPVRISESQIDTAARRVVDFIFDAAKAKVCNCQHAQLNGCPFWVCLVHGAMKRG